MLAEVRSYKDLCARLENVSDQMLQHNGPFRRDIEDALDVPQKSGTHYLSHVLFRKPCLTMSFVYWF